MKREELDELERTMRESAGDLLLRAAIVVRQLNTVFNRAAAKLDEADKDTAPDSVLNGKPLEEQQAICRYYAHRPRRWQASLFFDGRVIITIGEDFKVWHNGQDTEEELTFEYCAARFRARFADMDPFLTALQIED